MAKKQTRLNPTQAQLRATFGILRSQLRLADGSLRIRAIWEFNRELSELFCTEVDRRAQASGRSYQDEFALVEREAAEWQASPHEES